MSNQHTKGPWVISEEQGDNYVISSASNELEICTVWEDPNKADARLIAAAPDLLKELNNLCGAISSLNSGNQHAIEMNGERVYWQREEWVRWMLDEMLPNARAAIAKATEEQP